jgi:hypothetical protein
MQMMTGHLNSGLALRRSSQSHVVLALHIRPGIDASQLTRSFCLARHLSGSFICSAKLRYSEAIRRNSFLSPLS